MPWIILFPLSLTLLIETVIYMFLKWGDLKLFIVVSLANIVLNPVMNFILLSMTDVKIYYIFLISYEIGTTLLEALIIFLFTRIKFPKVLLFAIAANLASYLMGFAFKGIYQTKITIIVATIVLFVLYFAFEAFTIIYHSRKNAKATK